MIEVRNNRGISPIIATVLLIAISLALATIIFIWAYDFFGESIEKQGRTIEQSCEEVRFEAEIFGGNLSIKNAGDIPLYGAEVKEKNLAGGEVIEIGEFEQSIKQGESGEIDLTDYALTGKIIVTPVLLGKDESSYKKYICDDKYGQVLEM